VVTLSSVGHELSPVRLDDINFSDGKTYDPWLSYDQSKTANILFTKELSKRHPKLVALAVHPGAINTNHARHTSMDE
jgi:NAD(P)-dependent dehydrogenase (short-subunit alcohol dehydrogenase family)